MGRSSWVVVAVLAGLVACTKASRDVEETPAPPRVEPAPMAPAPIAVEDPGPRPGSDCYVRADLHATPGPDGVRLEFRLVNHGAEATTVTLTGRCPGGLVTVEGLPAGADPMHTCRAGACMEPRVEQAFTIPANGEVAIGGTVIQPGGDSCNPPLPPGASWLSATVTPAAGSPAVCTGKDAGLEVRNGTVRVLGTPPPPPPPAKKKPTRETKKEPTPPPPAPPPAPKKQRKDCPACGIGCTGNSFPKRGVGPDGCPYCACEELGPSIQTSPRPKPAPTPAPKP